MTVEIFTKEEFEQALPKDKNTGEKLWEYVGLIDNEHVYKVLVKNGKVKDTAILVRSSVGSNGVSAESGEDSIRIWLVDAATNKPLGKKVDAYTTRVTGWEKRMLDKIRMLYTQVLQMKACKKCGAPMVKRQSRYGEFWGCSSYPKCKYTENVSTESKPKQANKQEVKKEFKPSVYQQAIFDFVKSGTGNGVVQSVAGSGKTTTAIKSLDYVPQGLSVVFIAFNKPIADELSEKVPAGMEASTLHSLCLRNIKSANPKAKVDNRKLYWIIKDELEGFCKDTPDPEIATLLLRDSNAIIQRLVSLLKATMLEATRENLSFIASHWDIDTNGNEEFLFDFCIHVFKESIKQTWRVDFDDMIYFCASGMVPCKKFDRVFADECQDFNKAQIEVILKSVKKDGRVLAIGDSFQSIYHFRGADISAMPNLIEALDAKVLPLSITYRCPKLSVKLAKKIVPHIEHADWAIEGVVRTEKRLGIENQLRPGDLMVCRINAPLAKIAFRLIANGTKAVILGRDIGKSLMYTVKKVQKKHGVWKLDDVLYYLDEHVRLESDKAIKKGNDMRAQSLVDRQETIEALSEGCVTVKDLENRVNQVFSDKQEGVTLSTVHRAKGAEADRVFILYPELIPHPKATGKEQLDQEKNLYYVAVTRAKKELTFVEMPARKDK